jgi:hypothetical protein
MFSPQSNSFAFYVYNEGFALITDTSSVIYDHKLGAPVMKSGLYPEKTEKTGKALLQVIYDDYMKR